MLRALKNGLSPGIKREPRWNSKKKEAVMKPVLIAILLSAALAVPLLAQEQKRMPMKEGMPMQGEGMMMGKMKDMQGRMGEMRKGMGGMMKKGQGMMKSEDMKDIGSMMGDMGQMMGS